MQVFWNQNISDPKLCGQSLRQAMLRDEGMPRFKLKGSLERSALADLWKHTLSKIPTLYGRLMYLGGLRDQNSGIYRHHGLTTAFGREESGKALRESHEQAFAEWLNLPLAEKNLDLAAYLATLEDPPSEAVNHWLRTKTYRSQVPTSARAVERELFYSDLEMLLALIKTPESKTLELRKRE
jgi:hypothetical protein